MRQFMTKVGRLDRMRSNPRGDWSIKDVATLCKEHGIDCMPPDGGGSHWKVSDPSQHDILTVPAHRPIKAVYIRKLVRYVEQVRKARNAQA
jgi:hypothetical protein